VRIGQNTILAMTAFINTNKHCGKIGRGELAMANRLVMKRCLSPRVRSRRFYRVVCVPATMWAPQSAQAQVLYGTLLGISDRFHRRSNYRRRGGHQFGHWNCKDGHEDNTAAIVFRTSSPARMRYPSPPTDSPKRRRKALSSRRMPSFRFDAELKPASVGQTVTVTRRASRSPDRYRTCPTSWNRGSAEHCHHRGIEYA